MMKNEHTDRQDSLWIIEKVPMSEQKDHDAFAKFSDGPVTEYKISDLARYLINPSKIVISDKLVGCSVHEKNKKNGSIKSLFQFKKKPEKENWIELLSHSHVKNFTFSDPDLENHFNNIYMALRPYDPLIQKLSQLNANDIHDISGVCEDVSGTRYRLELKGNNEEKINYLVNNLLSDVTITMGKAYLSNGLFELRGFDFSSFNPDNNHRLIKYYSNSTAHYKVLTSPGNKGFDIDDPSVIPLLYIFDRSIHANPKLYDAILQCISAKARPFKLFFTKKIEITYTDKYLPFLFSKEQHVKDLHLSVKSELANTLNSQQKVVSFNYIPFSETGGDKMHTAISVLHSLNALDPLKNHFPDLYNTLSSTTPVSDNGKYYLLDAMQGCDD